MNNPQKTWHSERSEYRVAWQNREGEEVWTMPTKYPGQAETALENIRRRHRTAGRTAHIQSRTVAETDWEDVADA